MTIDTETVRGNAALAVSEISVHFKGFRAVDKVSFSIASGDIHGLIGPNGAGKTTLFNAVCGSLRPSAGLVRVNGNVVAPGNPRAAWQAGVARTFQKPELFWTLTVREHLDLPRRRAVKRGLTPPTADELIELLGIEGEVDRTVADLPLGTVRLVELARAVSTGAGLILMDEPCSGLDQRETTRLTAVLAAIQRQLGLTLLIVEHDMEFIFTIATNIFVIDAGRIIAEGTPSMIRQSPEVRRAYLGLSADELHEKVASTGTPPEAEVNR